MTRASPEPEFDDVFEELGEDHVAWLLVAANNYLRQQQPDRAIVLLDFLGLLDSHNLQGRKMLAYAHWLQGDWPRSAAVIESLLQRSLSDEDRVAVELMKLRLGDAVRHAQPANQPTGPG